jgi:ribosomal protein S30
MSSADRSCKTVRVRGDFSLITGLKNVPLASLMKAHRSLAKNGNAGPTTTRIQAKAKLDTQREETEKERARRENKHA